MKGQSPRFLIIMLSCSIVLSTASHIAEAPYLSGSTHSSNAINIKTEDTEAQYTRRNFMPQCITLNFLDSNKFVIAFDTVQVYTGKYISTNQEQVDISAFNILINGLTE